MILRFLHHYSLYHLECGNICDLDVYVRVASEKAKSTGSRPVSVFQINYFIIP